MIILSVLMVVLICLTIIGLILATQVSFKWLCPKRELQLLMYASLIAIVGVVILLDLIGILNLC